MIKDIASELSKVVSKWQEDFLMDHILPEQVKWIEKCNLKGDKLAEFIGTFYVKIYSHKFPPFTWVIKVNDHIGIFQWRHN